MINNLYGVRPNIDDVELDLNTNSRKKTLKLIRDQRELMGIIRNVRRDNCVCSVIVLILVIGAVVTSYFYHPRL
jgi:hypothetical protein